MSERESSMCFCASRMCSSNPYSARGHYTSTALPFEGFLECLMRFACLKALPTDEEIAAAGCNDAHGYIEWLRDEDENAYDEMMETRGTPWGSEPPQPADRCVDHLISMILRTIEATTTYGADKSLAHNRREMKKWWEGWARSSGRRP